MDKSYTAKRTGRAQGETKYPSFATMPFEPLGTDERLEKPAKRERDMDAVMLAGCSGFITNAFLTYGLAIWPFFVFPEIYLVKTLATCAAVGLLPSLVAGFVLAKRMGLPAAAGWVGGGLATSIFLYLRLDQLTALRNSNLPGEPEYPGNWAIIIPLSWLLVNVSFAAWVARDALNVDSKHNE